MIGYLQFQNVTESLGILTAERDFIYPSSIAHLNFIYFFLSGSSQGVNSEGLPGLQGEMGHITSSGCPGG